MAGVFSRFNDASRTSGEFVSSTHDVQWNGATTSTGFSYRRGAFQKQPSGKEMD